MGSYRAVFRAKKVTKGAVYSYYEFASDQLMDDASGSVASLPATSLVDLPLMFPGAPRMSSAKSLLTFLSPPAWRRAFPVRRPGTKRAAKIRKPKCGCYLPVTSLLSRGVERQLIHNPQSLSRALSSPFYLSADLAIGNLEGAVGSRDDCLEPGGQAPCFPIREELRTLAPRRRIQGNRPGEQSQLGPGPAAAPE